MPVLPSGVDYSAVAKASSMALVLSFASSVIAGFVAFWLMPVDVTEKVNAIEVPVVYASAMLLIGLLPFAIGGYLAAGFSPRSFLFHAVVTGIVLFVVYGMLCLVLGEDQLEVGEAITLPLIIPLAVLGGLVRRWQEGRRPSE